MARLRGGMHTLSILNAIGTNEIEEKREGDWGGGKRKETTDKERQGETGASSVGDVSPLSRFSISDFSQI